MSKINRYFHTISRNGTEYVFTNLMRLDDKYLGNAVMENGKPSELVSVLTRGEVKLARVTDTYPKKRKISDYVFMGLVVNEDLYRKGDKTHSKAWICFPDNKENITAVLESIGLSSKTPPDKYYFSDFKFLDSPQLPLSGKGDISEFNYLAEMIYRMTQDERKTFNAVVEAGKHTKNLADLINLTHNVDCYNVLDDVTSYLEYGRYFADMQDYNLDSIGDLQYFIDYEEYGKFAARETGGILMTDKFIEAGICDYERKYDSKIKNIPEAYRVTDTLPPISRSRSIEFMDAVVLSLSLDSVFRECIAEYADMYPAREERAKYFQKKLLDGEFAELYKLISELPEAERDELNLCLKVLERNYSKDIYMIYRVKGGAEYDKIRNSSYKDKRNAGISNADYDLFYSSVYTADTPSPENVLFDNKGEGRYIRNSDVLVMKINDKEKAYYYENGFWEITDFLKDLHLADSEKAESQKPSVKDKLKSLSEKKTTKAKKINRDDVVLGG